MNWLITHLVFVEVVAKFESKLSAKGDDLTFSPRQRQTKAKFNFMQLVDDFCKMIYCKGWERGLWSDKQRDVEKSATVVTITIVRLYLLAIIFIHCLEVTVYQYCSTCCLRWIHFTHATLT